MRSDYDTANSGSTLKSGHEYGSMNDNGCGLLSGSCDSVSSYNGFPVTSHVEPGLLQMVNAPLWGWPPLLQCRLLAFHRWLSGPGSPRACLHRPAGVATPAAVSTTRDLMCGPLEDTARISTGLTG